MSEDDKSLLAMAAARMSPASIAGTMGWSERRVTARLAKLAETQAAKPAAPVETIADVRRHVREVVEADQAMAGLRRLVAGLSRLYAIEVCGGLWVLALVLPLLGGTLAGRGLRGLAEGLPALLSVQVVAGLASATAGPWEAAAWIEGSAEGPMAVPAPSPGAPVCKGTPWTEAEDRRLRTVWATTTWGNSERLVLALERTIHAIRQRAKLLQLGRMGQGLPVAPAPVSAGLKRLRRKPVRPLEPMGERRGVERLKPVTGARLRYCRWFHDAAWPVGEIAALFDVAEGELAQALGVMQ